jgi:hypothetical protein
VATGGASGSTLPHRLERHFPVKTAVYFGVGRIRARGDMRANGRIPRPGNADLREVAAQWRRLAEDAEAKERYNKLTHYQCAGFALAQGRAEMRGSHNLAVADIVGPPAINDENLGCYKTRFR